MLTRFFRMNIRNIFEEKTTWSKIERKISLMSPSRKFSESNIFQHKLHVTVHIVILWLVAD